MGADPAQERQREKRHGHADTHAHRRGATATATSGRIAPAEKESAEAQAAWNGLGAVALVQAQLVTRVRGEGVLLGQSDGDLLRQVGGHPSLAVDGGQLRQLSGGVGLQLALLQLEVRLSVSRWELTDTYSPAAIDNAPAAIPAMPA